MLRITHIDEGDGVTCLRVEGRLTEETMTELERSWQHAARPGDTVVLDIEGVRFADPSGVRALRRAAAAGAVMVGLTGLVGEMLRDGSAAVPPAAPPRPVAGGNGDARPARTLAAPAADLVARLKANDAEAFELLVRRYGGRMLATARRFLRSDGDAADAVQDAFLSAFRAIGSFTESADLGTWLHRIVINTSLMKLRKRRRRPEESIDHLLPTFDEDGHFREPQAAWTTPGDTRLEQEDTRALVRRCIAQLPDGYRTVLLLRDIEDLDTDETAEALGLSTTAVKVRLHRARQALKTLIARARAGAAVV